MLSLDHVRWLGGGSGAGKSTIARLLAERHGAKIYSTDETLSSHAGDLNADAAPLVDQFRHMDLNERWVQRDPHTMYRSFPWFHGEGFELLVQDLQELPKDLPVIVEGFRLLPRLVMPLISDPRCAIWLLPTPEFRAKAFAARAGDEAFWRNTSDPDRALLNLRQRDHLFTQALAGEARRSGAGVLSIDGTAGIEDVAASVARRFGWDH